MLWPSCPTLAHETDEVPRGSHSRHRDTGLKVVREGIGLELGSEPRPVGPEALAKNAGTGAVLTAVARPDDDEAPVGPHGRYLGVALVSGRVRVGLKLGSELGSGRSETLSENTDATAVLAVVRPRDDEISRRSHARRGRSELAARRVGVDLELGPQGGPVPEKSLTEDAESTSILRESVVPHDDEAFGRPNAGHRGKVLVARGERVGLKLRRPQGSAAR